MNVVLGKESRAVVVPLIVSGSLKKIGGPSCSSRVVATPPDSNVQKLLAREAEKQSKATEAKAERERIAQLPETKAKRWADGLRRDIAACETLLAEIPGASTMTGVQTMYIEYINEHTKDLQNLRHELLHATGDTAAEVIKRAPAVLQQYKGRLARWKKVRQLF